MHVLKRKGSTVGPVTCPHPPRCCFRGEGGRGGGGRSAVCTRSLGFQFSRITTLTPSPLKTNLEFQSVDEAIKISS